MSGWVESSAKLKTFVESPQSYRTSHRFPAEDFVESLTGWLETSIAEYTEGTYEAISRRAVWVFDDRWIVTIGSGINVVIAGLHDKVSSSDSVTSLGDLDVNEWVFDEGVNGWSSTEPLDCPNFVHLLESLSVKYGKPELKLPWEYWIMRTVDDGEDYYSYWEDDEEKLPVYKSFYELMVMLSEGKLDNVSPWNFSIVGEEDSMSDYCVYSRFNDFVADLQESGEWLVILDEHCAACASGTRKSFYDEDEKWKTAPEFMTWGQNSQNAYTPDGKMWAEVWVEEYSYGLQLIRIANKHGFNMSVPETADDYSGEVTFE